MRRIKSRISVPILGLPGRRDRRRPLSLVIARNFLDKADDAPP
jgi:hypothetical protein